MCYLCGKIRHETQPPLPPVAFSPGHSPPSSTPRLTPLESALPHLHQNKALHRPLSPLESALTQKGEGGSPLPSSIYLPASLPCFGAAAVFHSGQAPLDAGPPEL